MEEKGSNSKLLIIFIVLLIIVIFVFMIYNIIVSKKEAKPNIEEQNTVESQENFVNPNLLTDIEKLSKMQEYDRVKYYLDKYLFYVEEQQYEKAYSLLSDEFKTEHFNTLEKYKEFIIKKYPVVNTIKYQRYDKLGRYHVLTIEISDILNATDDKTPMFEQKFIVVENELNNFVLAFQAE